MKSIISVFFILVFMTASYAQSEPKKFESKDSLYNANIKKSKLYGVYIPRDIDDAMVKLMELTTEEARKPLVRINEDTIARKLHFGIGRWMEYNWNFAEGSRFSHYLREKGLTHVDDMTRFMLITFHRHISDKPLYSEVLIAKIVAERKKKIKEAQDKLPVIHQEKKKIDKN